MKKFYNLPVAVTNLFGSLITVFLFTQSFTAFGSVLPNQKLAHPEFNAYAPMMPVMKLKLVCDQYNWDEIAVCFDGKASAKYSGNEDAVHFQGYGMESLASISSDNIDLAINALPLPAEKPLVVRLDVEVNNSGSYTLEKTAFEGDFPKLYRFWLVDNFKKDSLDIRSNSDYTFTVDKSDSTSFGSKRFQLVIYQDPALGVHLLDFTAAKSNNGTELSWQCENEERYTRFNLEKSSDYGKNYNAISKSTSDSIGTYSYLDKNIDAATDLYRLKIEDLNGKITYSNILTIGGPMSKPVSGSSISVYPNPAVATLNISVNDADIKGSGSGIRYEITVTNNSGKVLMQAQSQESTYQSDIANLSPGTYFMTVVKGTDKSLVGRSRFIKQ